MGDGRQFVVAITGASGAVYGRRLVQLLAEGGTTVHLVISPLGRRLLGEELGMTNPEPSSFTAVAASRIRMYGFDDLGCELASGSFLTDGMIVCPCSSNTLAAIAAGLGDNLISRSAQVTLKQARKLVVCPREMPISQIDIRNMLRLSLAGGIICPASPGFYMQPQSIDELVDFVVGKLLDVVGVAHGLKTRWADRLGPGKTLTGVHRRHVL